MTLYDISEGLPLPEVGLMNLPIPLNLRGGIPSMVIPLRIVHEAGEAVSALFAVVVGDKAELHLYTAPGNSHETSSNPIHHHVTAFSADPELYAAHLPVWKFEMVYRPGSEDFISQRFPEWTLEGTRNGWVVATLEL